MENIIYSPLKYIRLILGSLIQYQYKRHFSLTPFMFLSDFHIRVVSKFDPLEKVQMY